MASFSYVVARAIARECVPSRRDTQDTSDGSFSGVVAAFICSCVFAYLFDFWTASVGFLVTFIFLALFLESEFKRRSEAAADERRTRAIQLADVDSMDGWEFEHYVARLLCDRGFTAEVTNGSNDFGVDVIASNGTQRFAIQVKRHAKNVSRRAVSDAVAGKQHYGCNAAAVVTNSYFTKGAVELAGSTSYQLIDRDELGEWILAYQGNREDQLDINREDQLDIRIPEASKRTRSEGDRPQI